VDHPHANQRLGEFYVRHDAALAERVLDQQGVQFEDLNVQRMFRRQPKPLPSLALARTLTADAGATHKLVLRAPSIDR